MTQDKNSKPIRVNMTVKFEIKGQEITGTVTMVDDLQNRIGVEAEGGASYNLEAYTVEVV